MNDKTDSSHSRAASDVRGTESSDEIRDIRESIDQTRAQMTHTLHELQERLSPAHIKAQIRDQIRHATIGKVENMAQRANDRMYEARQTVVSTVTSCPLLVRERATSEVWISVPPSEGAKRAVTHRTESGRSGSGAVSSAVSPAFSATTDASEAGMNRCSRFVAALMRPGRIASPRATGAARRRVRSSRALVLRS